MKDYDTKIKHFGNFFNKYKILIITLAFLVWLVFIDRNNVIKLIRYNKELNELTNQELFLKEKIARDSAKIQELRSNDASLEKFAREQYFFHKPNEDVYKIDPQ